MHVGILDGVPNHRDEDLASEADLLASGEVAIPHSIDVPLLIPVGVCVCDVYTS